MKRFRLGLVRLVDLSGDHPFTVLLLAILLTAGSTIGTHRYLSIDTDTEHLFSNRLPWRQQSLLFTRQFPQFNDTLIAVVRAPTAEEARAAASALAQNLVTDRQHIRAVTTPAINSFLDREGLLLLPPGDLSQVLKTLSKTAPLLGPLASDPSARGLLTGVDMLVEGVRRGMPISLSTYDPALNRVADTFEDALAGKPAPLSWQALLTPTLANPSGSSQFVLIHPVLDYHVLEPGLAATQAVLHIAAALPDVKAGRAKVSYTGSVPLSDEEFHSLTDRALPIALGSGGLLLVWLGLALRSWRMIVPVVLTLSIGLSYTLGFAALTVGRLNLISVAFTVLFVGLAVDFGIQFAVRLRGLQHNDRAFADTLHETASRVGKQIGLAALATSCGFLAFAPTNFTGVAELGIIAGVGMLIALLCTLTVLPALLTLFAQKSHHEDVALPGGAVADAWLRRHRIPVLVASALLAVGGLWGVLTIAFDANPLHTKRADSEAMRTLAALMDDPTANPFTINVMVKDLSAARNLSTRFSALPEVGQVISGASFIPPDQSDKLKQIQQVAHRLDFLLKPHSTAAAPTITELRTAVQTTQLAIAGIARQLPPNSALLRIKRALAQLAQAPAETLGLANESLVRFLPNTLALVNESLAAAPITLKTLPPELYRDWFTPNGEVRIQITPTPQAQNTGGLRHFVDAVYQVTPQALGPAVDTVHAADTILSAFEEAAAYAILAIAVVLMIVLRRVRDTALVLVTLLMSALLTALFARLIGLSINFANIIALPLLLGIGVSFNVYFVMNWRNGMLEFLGSPTARAILFSALTTGTAFGALAIARHPGTASMGTLLLLSLVAVLLSTFVFLPALLFMLSNPGGPRCNTESRPSNVPRDTPRNGAR